MLTAIVATGISGSPVKNRLPIDAATMADATRAGPGRRSPESSRSCHRGVIGASYDSPSPTFTQEDSTMQVTLALRSLALLLLAGLASATVEAQTLEGRAVLPADTFE